ncbi:hypothetical protein GJAV_G00103520 [Gymnothorax javanicus]|nr:hypothetical protein GJAV_G00103520 [Gymnothorax javanicus]
MPVSVTKGDGFSVFTMTSDPGSKLPLLCQVLAAFCCCPACMVSDRLRKLMAGPYSTLGTVQMMGGLLTIGLGLVHLSVYFGPYALSGVCPPYWTGPIFIVSGILCIVTERCAVPCLVSMNAAIHLASAVLAVTSIAFYLIDDGPRLADVCISYEPPSTYTDEDDYGFRRKVNMTAEQRNVTESNFHLCQMYKGATLPIVIGLKVLLVLLATLQICVAISVAVLNIKALKKNGEEQVTEVQQSLLDEEVTANPVT